MYFSIGQRGRKNPPTLNFYFSRKHVEKLLLKNEGLAKSSSRDNKNKAIFYEKVY